MAIVTEEKPVYGNGNFQRNTVFIVGTT